MRARELAPILGYTYSLNSFSYTRQEVTELVSSYIHAVITRHNRQTQTAVHFYLLHLGMGAINNYVDQILTNFEPPTPLEWTILDILKDTYSLFT